MNIEEAIKTAIEYENKIVDLYRKAVADTDDPVGKKIMKILADEEVGHVAYLESRLEEWKKTGTVTAEKLDTAIPSREVIEKGMSGMEKKMSAEDRSGEIELLRKALDAEIEATKFYKKMVDELSDEAKALFARFVEIEEGHEAIVQSEIDSMTGLGYWFDFQEFNLEAG